MELPLAKDIDVTSEDMDNCPPGMTLSIMPPTREYMADPMWFDQIGRDPIHAGKIFQRFERGEISREKLRVELEGVMEKWPRYGPAVLQKAAKEGRADVVEVLIDTGVESDPKSMKNRNRDEVESGGDDDEDSEDSEDGKDSKDGEDDADDGDGEGGDDDEEMEDEEAEPLLEVEHAYLTAIFEGHLDIVKLLVEKGGVPINYDKTPTTAPS